MTRKTGTVEEDVSAFMTIFRSLLLRMGNVSDKSCRENQTTHFMFNEFFPRKSCRLWDNVEKYCRAGRATDGSIIRLMRFAFWINNAANTPTEYVMRIALSCTRLIVALYVHYLSCSAVGPTQPPDQWLPQVLSVVLKCLVVQLAADLGLVPKFKAECLACHSLHSA